MAAGDVWRVLWRWEDGNTTKQYTTGLHVIVGAGDVTFDEDLQAAMTQFWTDVKDNYPTSLVLDLIELRQVKPADAGLFQETQAVAGTAANDDMAPGSAVVVSTRTALAGRSYRGRMYLPGVAKSKTTATSDVASTTASDIKTAIETFDASAVSAGIGFAPIVFSRQHTPPGETEPVIEDHVERITRYEVDVNLRSQRRRQTRAPAYI